WYVTGRSGGQTHRGNLFGQAAATSQSEQAPSPVGDLDDVKRFIDVSLYPGSHSDIVALMVLEHQPHLHNFITRLHFESSQALRSYGQLRYLKTIVNAFLKYLLFTEETPLTAAISGSPEFRQDFTAAGPRDPQGRSLRDFDLQTRLFKFPCSYLIYSQA